MEVQGLTLRGLLSRRRPDRDLLASALAGDSVAFAEVYQRFASRIHGFCMAKLSDPEAAADAVQEVFLRVLRSGAPDVENPAAWLQTIAHNVVVDSVRASRRRPVAAEIGDDVPVLGVRAPADSTSRAEDREGVRDVLLAMRALPPRYRTALVMRDIKSLTGAEAAAELGTSTGALDTLLHRARRAFRSEHDRLEALPAACRGAARLLYEPDPALLSDHQRQALEVHMLGCPQCRAERSRIKRRRAMQAILPFLFPAERGADVISRVVLVGAEPMTRVAAVGIAVALAVVPSGLAVRAHVADAAAPARPSLARAAEVRLVAGAAPTRAVAIKRLATAVAARYGTPRPRPSGAATRSPAGGSERHIVPVPGSTPYAPVGHHPGTVSAPRSPMMTPRPMLRRPAGGGSTMCPPVSRVSPPPAVVRPSAPACSPPPAAVSSPEPAPADPPPPAKAGPCSTPGGGDGGGGARGMMGGG